MIKYLPLALVFLIQNLVIGQKPIRWKPETELHSEVTLGFESILLKDYSNQNVLLNTIFFEPLLFRGNKNDALSFGVRIIIPHSFVQGYLFREKDPNGSIGTEVMLPQNVNVSGFGYSLHYRKEFLKNKLRTGLDWGFFAITYFYDKLQYDPKAYSSSGDLLFGSTYGILNPYVGANFRIGIMRCFADITYPARWHETKLSDATVNRPTLWLRMGFNFPMFSKDLIKLDIYELN